jgi:hypothetical protein
MNGKRVHLFSSRNNPVIRTKPCVSKIPAAGIFSKTDIDGSGQTVPVKDNFSRQCPCVTFRLPQRVHVAQAYGSLQGTSERKGFVVRHIGTLPANLTLPFQYLPKRKEYQRQLYQRREYISLQKQILRLPISIFVRLPFPA